MTARSFLLLLWLSFASGFLATVERRQTINKSPVALARRALVRRPVFLDECQLREDAWQWAKEVSKTNKPRPCVIALYDSANTCVYVGMHFDTALAVGHFVKKHGKETVAALREEPFPPEVSKEQFGVNIMKGLVQSWLTDVTASEGGTAPVGNVEASWSAFDPNESPFIVGAFGGGGGEDEEDQAVKDVSDMTEEELLDMRREGLFQSLNEAMAAGEEATAAGLMKRLNQLGGKVAEGNDDGDDSTPLG